VKVTRRKRVFLRKRQT